MCGRFTLRAPAADWCQLFLPDFDPEHLPADFDADPPRFNIAPTQAVSGVYREATGGPRQLMKTRWGLVPSWAKDLSIGSRMINARGETVDSKPSFRNAFASRRCLIPTDGYYEWKKVTGGKQPYLMERSGGGVLAMAGLWEENKRVADVPIRTCTIITTDANETTADLHHRMPVFLNPEDFDQWLDPGYRDLASLKKLMTPADEDLLVVRPVSRRVNNVKHDDEQCVLPEPDLFD